ncbi:alcohol dehydrogenase catalytic domain-containing protein [Streptomyces sp. NPDC051105]|uniref:alcohol dehydrogenase catalytic domain-containing protein n=1 Tax=Streptomyces sp. NPDC051105 TaxID=3154843 RepID=UPI003444BFAC
MAPQAVRPDDGCARRAGPGEPFEATTVDRREVGPTDVLVDIAYCGVCLTDVSRIRSAFGTTTCPLAPGHETPVWCRPRGPR